jgi:CRISPR-associated protein Csd2
MGSAHAHELFDRISIKRKDEAKAARSFDDYKILVNEAGLSGVKLFRRIAG